MEKTDIIKTINNFEGKRVGIIGDLMLDHFIRGDAERISPEAPIPVVLAQQESFMPGGAGNVASNVVALGGKAFVVGLVGNDSAGKVLLSEFKKRGIGIEGVIIHATKPTTQKIRVVARNQQIVRVDKEDAKYINSDIEKKLAGFVTSNIKKWDALVVSDYEKGVITENLGKILVGLSSKYNKPIICDVKPKHAPFFKNVTLLSPNHKESLQIAKISDENEAGKIIQKQLNCNVLLTQGARGMTLFENKKVKHFSSIAGEVVDVGGAGDTVVAAVTLSLAAGAKLEQASIIANCAAGISVGKPGTAVVLPFELKKHFENA